MLTTPETRQLRDLSSKDFETQYGCDRLTATILSSRFQYVIEHICGRLLATAFSPVIRDFYDFSAALVGPPDLNYQTPAVAKSMALFFGSIRDAVANTVDEFGPANLCEGDVLISNDPYRSGTHVNDVCFIRPVFSDGTLVNLLTIRAHMMDMGGIVPGGFTGTKKNVYETGLVIPPTLLYRDNRPVKSTLSLIFDNTRFGELLVLDFESIRQALSLGEGLLHETVRRHGASAVSSTIRYACDVSAETMSEALRLFPDGVYEGEDFIDCDAVDATVMYRVAVRVTKVGARAEVDLAGSSRQARTCINGAWPDVKSAVAIALKFLLDPMSPFTSAVTRPIDIVAPPGTVMTAMPPDGAVMLYWEALVPTVAAVCRALKFGIGREGVRRHRPCAHHAALHRRTTGRNAMVQRLQPERGMGRDEGRRCRQRPKGARGQLHGHADRVPRTGDSRPRYAEGDVPDSGGPGRYRGGAGSATDSFFLEPSESHVSSNHTRSAPGDGAFGGRSGSSDGVWVWEPQGDDTTPRYLSLEDSSYANPIAVGRTPWATGSLRPRRPAPGGPDGRRRAPEHLGLLRAGRLVAAPHDRPDPGNELAKAEGLDDVVIRAQLQPHHPVDLGAARRDDQDRDRRAGPQLLAEVVAVDIGQAQVEQHQPPASGRAGLGPGRHPADLESLPGESFGQGFGDAVIVLYHQDSHPQRMARGHGRARAPHRAVGAGREFTRLTRSRHRRFSRTWLDGGPSRCAARGRRTEALGPDRFPPWSWGQSHRSAPGRPDPWPAAARATYGKSRHFWSRMYTRCTCHSISCLDTTKVDR